MARHKWSGKVNGTGHTNDYGGGMIAGCLKCPCTKEIIRGRVMYYFNEAYYDKAPNCDERFWKTEWEGKVYY